MRVIAITLGFVPSRIWRQSCASFYVTKSEALPVEHVFVDQHYPLNHDVNQAENREICEQYGIIYLDPGRNLGLHGGFNWALERIGYGKDDVIIGYDPDSNPLTPGWDMALATTMRDRSVVWSTLMLAPVEAELLRTKAYVERRIEQLRVWELKAPIMNSICAWRGSFLKQAGGLSEPNAFYGGLECAMWVKMVHERDKWVFLPDYWEDHTFHWQQDPEYRHYKWRHAHQRDWPGDFASFVEAGCPGTPPTSKQLS